MNASTQPAANVIVKSAYSGRGAWRVVFEDGDGNLQYVLHTNPWVSVQEMVTKAGGDFHESVVEFFTY